HRREPARGGGEHADHAQGHAAGGALQGDVAHAAADVNQLVDGGERRLEHDGVGGFGGNVAVVAEGDADGGCLHRRRVVDAVAEEEGRTFGDLVANDGQLFFGAGA